MEKLNEKQIAQFIKEGFIKLNNAFPVNVADECREILWKATQCDPYDKNTWTQPVVRIGESALEPFRNASNTPLLLNAFDQLAGKGNWIPRLTLGSFPIRFPCRSEATDTGWHVDASFPGDQVDNFLDWRVNINSKGRALLMLFLFSDVGVNDAPTRIRVGSHFDVAGILNPEGEKGLSFMELSKKLDCTKHRKKILATGKAGTVFLCHPFLVHAAQAHHGKSPKFMAQPPLLTRRAFKLHRPDNNYCPVEAAIMEGLASYNV